MSQKRPSSLRASRGPTRSGTSPEGRIIRALSKSLRTGEERRGQPDGLNRFHAVAVGRAARMIELKNEFTEHGARTGGAPPYPLGFEQEENEFDTP